MMPAPPEVAITAFDEIADELLSRVPTTDLLGTDQTVTM
jgi:hypothetical protein